MFERLQNEVAHHVIEFLNTRSDLSSLARVVSQEDSERHGPR
jgi:hypothetical protein